MKKIWYLSSCTTCKRIMKELDIKKEDSSWNFWDLKNNSIKINDLELIKKSTGLKYEDLFNKRSQKYKNLNFSSENEFKEAILKEYTFLKRPIIQINNKFFVGNNKKIIEELKKELL